MVAPNSVKIRGRTIGVGVLVIFLAGCANVTFYRDPSLKRESRTGLLYYPAKPYLLVTRTGNKESPIKAEIVSLPDTERPFYAVYRPGWGSHQFNLKLANGILTEYGQITDSKGPETIGATGQLAAGLGSAATGFGALWQAFQGANASNQSAKVDAAKQAIASALAALATLTPEKFPQFEAALKVADNIRARLQAIAAAPSIPALRGVQKSLGDAIIATTASSQTEGYNNTLKIAGDYVAAAIAALSEETQPITKPDFELYEIEIENGRTRLRRCPE